VCITQYSWTQKSYSANNIDSNSLLLLEIRRERRLTTLCKSNDQFVLVSNGTIDAKSGSGSDPAERALPNMRKVEWDQAI